MKKYIQYIFLLTFPFIYSQSILNKGDVMVIGLNSNAIPCSEIFADEIYFISFVPITTGTTIDLTDNGWERVYPNYFGTTEGVYRFTYTNPVPISSGSIFKLRMTINAGNMGESTTNPDWEFTNLNENIWSINISSSGDQLFIMQGGNWQSTEINHQGTYSGNLLHAYNSTNVWNAVNNTFSSNLPDDLECFHTTPSSISPFRHYNFSFPENSSETSETEWKIRLHNPDKWINELNCQDFNENFSFSNLVVNNDLVELEFCKNENATINIENSEYAFYQWYRNETENTTNSTILEGETNASLLIDTTLIGTNFYYCEVILNLSYDESICPILYSRFYQVTVNTPNISPIEHFP